MIKIDLATGDLKWILGTPEGWNDPQRARLLEPVGDLAWTFHQHSPMLTPTGNLLLKPPLSEYYSRVVEYAIDEEAHTVSQVWSMEGRVKTAFSPISAPTPTGSRRRETSSSRTPG